MDTIDFNFTNSSIFGEGGLVRMGGTKEVRPHEMWSYYVYIVNTNEGLRRKLLWLSVFRPKVGYRKMPLVT
jgi:hypothetical protein